MRRLPQGVAISVTVHVAAVAAVGAYDPAERPAQAAAEMVPVEIVAVQRPPEPEPVDVALLDGPPAPTPEPVRRRAQAVATTPRAATVETTAPAPTIEPPPTSLLTMRGRTDPARVNIGLPERYRTEEHVPAGTKPDFGPRPTGQLQENGGGTYRSEQGPFTAKIDRDGGVRLKDEKNFRIGLSPPTPKQIGQGISDWYQSDKGADGQRGTKTLEKEVSGSIDAGDRSKTASVGIFKGGFDITDAFMRRKGADPYAAAKLRFLDSTRDERVEIGKRYRAQQLAQVHQIMVRNLDRLWGATSDTAARKKGLFELWDECVETGEPLVVEAARSARKLVVAFVHSRLPAGSPDAYTAAELAALNARKQSTAMFAPYD